MKTALDSRWSYLKIELKQIEEQQNGNRLRKSLCNEYSEFHKNLKRGSQKSNCRTSSTCCVHNLLRNKNCCRCRRKSRGLEDKLSEPVEALQYVYDIADFDSLARLLVPRAASQ